MTLFDTHAHLDDRRFDADRDAVIQRARTADVATILTVGADLPSSRTAVALAEQYPFIYAAVGIHPHEAQTVTPDVLAELRRLTAHPRVVAVGEIGLDFYYDLSPQEVQQEAFQAQLTLAAEICKPLVLHLRDKKGENDAHRIALAILQHWLTDHSPAMGPIGVLHCFSGDLETAQKVIEMGFYLGVDGPVTYPNAAALRALVAQIPPTHLLLETDCPYLAPQRRRGRRNEPAFLAWIADQVAELWHCTPNKVARITTANARRLFFKETVAAPPANRPPSRE